MNYAVTLYLFLAVCFNISFVRLRFYGCCHRDASWKEACVILYSINAILQLASNLLVFYYSITFLNFYIYLNAQKILIFSRILYIHPLHMHYWAWLYHDICRRSKVAYNNVQIENMFSCLKVCSLWNF